MKCGGCCCGGARASNGGVRPPESHMSGTRVVHSVTSACTAGYDIIRAGYDIIRSATDHRPVRGVLATTITTSDSGGGIWVKPVRVTPG